MAETRAFSSPDSVDELMSVTSSAGWMQMAALGGIIIAVLVWSALTDVPIKVKTKGMLLGSEGLAEVTLASRGRLAELDVSPGDTINEGDLVALVEQPELSNQIALREAQLHDAEGRENALLAFVQRSGEAQTASAASRVHSAEERITLLLDREDALRQRDKDLRGLEQKGFTTRETVLRNRGELIQVSEQIVAARHEVAAAQNELKLNDAQRDKELATVRQEIIRITAEIEQQQQLLRANSELRSPYTGRVLEVKHTEGEFVEIGAPVVSLVRTDESADPHAHLIGIIFAPPETGKEIRDGMVVNLAPSGVQSNEYGFMRGRVVEVSDAPATSAGMMHVLKNDTLVRKLAENGAPFQVEVELERAETPSGFAWTSSAGPDRRIGGGTPCDADVVVRKTRLLGLILPPLARFFRP